METSKPLWIKTIQDGVFPFKNVCLAVEEKETQGDPPEYPHLEENWYLDFDEGQTLFPVSSKYYHTDMGVMCTVTERTEDEEGKLTNIKVRLEGLDSEAVIDNTPEGIKPLKNEFDFCK